MRYVVVALSLMLAGGAGPAYRAETALAQAPGHDPADCWCRAQGRTFAVGEKVCLRTPDGPRLAQCGMALNVTSWILSDTPCLDS
ncbi:hypothetical protein [Microvirga thermotolerans]|uniref:DUF333 domain-containing protein n=1 Tax=Microvirga thermotolerans TaxID=2651334 RepID=A0A5P9JZW5_9HYPH|nr:hypothetical protein [Microvirga thermotolerans]QFU17278.1 hypothetical protein GDR74_14200 [Microvirga thermotolerans]